MYGESFFPITFAGKLHLSEEETSKGRGEGKGRGDLKGLEGLSFVEKQYVGAHWYPIIGLKAYLECTIMN